MRLIIINCLAALLSVQHFVGVSRRRPKMMLKRYGSLQSRADIPNMREALVIAIDTGVFAHDVLDGFNGVSGGHVVVVVGE